MASNAKIPGAAFMKRSRWKYYLSIIGLVIISLTLIFVNYLSQKLKKAEETIVELRAKAYETIDEKGLDEDVTIEAFILEKAEGIPIIITNSKDEVQEGNNFGTRNNDLPYLSKVVERLKRQDFEPIEVDNFRVYYKNSKYYTLLVYFPLIQFFLLAAFITLGYIGFSAARRSEQNQVWVGMAKETAHQLGTPISAIVAWIEYLKELAGENEEQQEIIKELSNDVNRLNLIADRFSKIGSAPKLDKINIYEELEKCKNYMAKRASRKVVFDFPDIQLPPKFVNINPHLFDWVIENLLRNALDAMKGEGKIAAKVEEDQDYVTVHISDTGSGIPSNKLKTVFQPGYTTKTRGWGLGLSLAKRIVEIYHKGKIFVSQSQINKGTTFTIKLPRA